MRTPMASFTRAVSTAGLAALLAACTSDTATAPHDLGAPALSRAASAGDAGRSGLAAVRAATAKYHRVEQAIADGYVSTVVCASRPPEGAMGIHYVNPGLRADATFNPTRPEVLVYEPQENGKLRLVAVEYFIWRNLWDAANPGAEPSFLNQPFFRSFGPAAHGEADHYELHVWLWRHNPSGMFAQWNPDVTCR